MSIVDLFAEPKQSAELEGAVYGVVVALVSSIDDPDELGRVKLRFPWLKDDSESDWARVACFMAGPDRGALFRPEVGDEVLVLFEHGDMRFPYVIGALWNGQDTAPGEKQADADNNIRLIKSRSGHLVVFDDTADAEKIEIVASSGNDRITIDAAENTISVSSAKDIVLSAPDGKVSFECGNLEIAASASVKIESSADMEIKASGTLTLEGATVNIN
jgi:uncharacterized protein involved in type VI secretion and phage assembly